MIMYVRRSGTAGENRVIPLFQAVGLASLCTILAADDPRSAVIRTISWSSPGTNRTSQFKRSVPASGSWRVVGAVRQERVGQRASTSSASAARWQRCTGLPRPCGTKLARIDGYWVQPATALLFTYVGERLGCRVVQQTAEVSLNMMR